MVHARSDRSRLVAAFIMNQAIAKIVRLMAKAAVRRHLEPDEYPSEREHERRKGIDPDLEKQRNALSRRP
jgi:hypothetical protein